MSAAAGGEHRDLADHHRPLLAPTESSSAFPAAPLRGTEELLRRFEQDGFTGPVPLLTPVALERLHAEVARVAEPSHPGHTLFHEFHRNEAQETGRVLFHALGGWRLEPGLHDLLFHPTVVRVAESLLGGPVRFWHDQLFCKPPREGGVVAWHQDYSYWTRTYFRHDRPVAHLTCFVALDDCDAENGAVRYVPGSHRWPLLPITGLTGDMKAIDSVLSDEQRQEFEPRVMELRAGEASFHHALTVHGSFGNDSDRPRRAVVLNLCRDGTRCRSDEPLLAGVPVLAHDAPLGGKFFPLLSGHSATA